MPRNYKKIAHSGIRYLLGIIFLLSGIGKLIDSSDARYLVELMATRYFVLIEYASSIVYTISIVEIILAVFLIWGKQLKSALTGSFLLVTLFSSVLGYFYLQGQSIENCGCFGALGIGAGIEATLLRNLVLFVLIIVAFILSVRRSQTDFPEN